MKLVKTDMRLVLMAVLVLVTASGCRTYGAYGNKEATLREIQRANQVFESELKQAQSTLSTIEQSGRSNPLYRAYGEEYRATVIAHETFLDSHRKWAESAQSHEGSYRYMHRVLGAILSDQQVIHDRYAYLQARVPTKVDSGHVNVAGIATDARYQAVPPYYQRILNRQQQNPAAARQDTVMQNVR